MKLKSLGKYEKTWRISAYNKRNKAIRNKEKGQQIKRHILDRNSFFRHYGNSQSLSNQNPEVEDYDEDQTAEVVDPMNTTQWKKSRQIKG